MATLIGGFALVVLLLGANSLLSYRNIRRVADNGLLVTRSREVLGELGATLSSLQDAETGQRGFIISGDEAYLEPYASGTREVGTHLDRLKALVVAPSVKRHIPRLEAEIEERLEILRRNVAVRRSQGFDAARGRILSGDGKRIMDEARRTIGLMQDGEGALLRQREVESAASGRTALATLGVSSLATLVLLGAVMLVVRRAAAQRERAAEAAEASSERLEAIVASTSQIVWTRTPSGDFLDPQPTWSEFTGLPFESIKGRGWMDAIHPDDRERVAAGWDAALASPGAYRVEYRLRRADGEYRDMSVSAVARVRGGRKGPRVGGHLHGRDGGQSRGGPASPKRGPQRGDPRHVPRLHRGDRRPEPRGGVEPRGREDLRLLPRRGGRALAPRAHHPALASRRPPRGARALPRDGRGACDRPAHRGARAALGRARDPRGARDPADRRLGAAVVQRHAPGHRRPQEGRGRPGEPRPPGGPRRRRGARPDPRRGAAAMLQACAEALARDLGAALVRVWTLDEAGEALELRASAGIDLDVHGSQSRLPVAEHPIGRIARDRKPRVALLDPDDPSFGERRVARARRDGRLRGLPAPGRRTGPWASWPCTPPSRWRGTR